MAGSKGAAVADALYDTQKVPYTKLASGLNTLKAPHDISRSELSALVNAWYAYGASLSKRPGSVPAISAMGSTGGGVGGSGIVTARFNDVTYVLVQQGSTVWAGAPGVPGATWQYVGNVTAAGTLRGAQMFDPSTQLDTLFVVTGYDVPQTWTGPGSVLKKVKTGTSSAGVLPNKPNTLTPITPAFVSTLGNNSHLFYSGEASVPCGVYISDPFYPQSFTTPAMNADPYGYTGAGGIFTPALIGFNDGVDGGNITGLQTMGFAMVVFKEAAIYAMVQTQLLGNVAWQVYNVCSSRGALSPRSIVAFETFTVFLSIDGVYYTQGQPQEDMTSQKISKNVPSYFDSTRFGQPAAITNRRSAVAVREGNRYIIWFDTGQGVPTTGVWFDFDVTGDQSMPAAGEIGGMAVGGAASLAGPNDSGNFVWVDAQVDRVGLFGIGFADFGEPITVSLTGKADYFDDLYGPQAPIKNKVPARCDLVVVPFSGQATQTLSFVGSIGVDYKTPVPSSTPLPTLSVVEGTGLWGDTWGAFNWTSGAFAESGYSIGTLRPQKGAVGHLLSVSIGESSVYPWILLGYILELNAHEVTI